MLEIDNPILSGPEDCFRAFLKETILFRTSLLNLKLSYKIADGWEDKLTLCLMKHRD
jgi:hypothetical protein